MCAEQGVYATLTVFSALGELPSAGRQQDVSFVFQGENWSLLGCRRTPAIARSADAGGEAAAAAPPDAT